MNDSLSLADKPRAGVAANGRIGPCALLFRLGVAAAIAAAASLAAPLPVTAQSQQAPGAQPEPPKPAPRRRGIFNPDGAAPGGVPSSSSKSYKGRDDDSVPGGLPGAQPKPPTPGGGPTNPGG
jgi:hypothetical protein